MKPIVRSIPLLVFLLTGFPLMAQQVITTVKGEQFNTRVKRIDKEVVRTASLGIGMSIPAANRLKAFKEGTSTSSADLRFGPTPDGYYGLTLRF
jgi:hypothetical protein